MSPPPTLADFGLDFFSLAGRRAVVTGGNTGLGQAFTVALARAGADVFVPSILDDDGETAALVDRSATKSAPGHAHPRLRQLRIDLTERGAAQEVVDACVRELGGIDVLVNSAGICRVADVADFDRGPWDEMVSVNLTVAFDLTRAAITPMRRQGHGKIVNIASLFSFLGGLGSPAYAATKHGIVGLTRAYADELGADNIQVNALAPGYIATSLTERTRTDPVAGARVVDHLPARRWGDPADLMGALVFLASRASDYVTGQVIAVDGGYLVR